MERRELTEARLDRDFRRLVKRLVPCEQGAAPGLKPGTLRQHHELGGGELLAQCGQHRRVAGHAADQQHPRQLTLAFLQQRNHFVGHAVVQRVQNVLRRGLVSVELVRDVRFAVNRATRSQRHHFACERAPDCFLEADPHPAELLHKKLPASGGAFIVRQNVDDPSLREKINQKRLSSQ